MPLKATFFLTISRVNRVGFLRHWVCLANRLFHAPLNKGWSSLSIVGQSQKKSTNDTNDRILENLGKKHLINLLGALALAKSIAYPYAP